MGLDKIQSDLQSDQQQPEGKANLHLVSVGSFQVRSNGAAMSCLCHTLKLMAVSVATSVRKSHFSRATVLIKIFLLHQLNYLMK